MRFKSCLIPLTSTAVDRRVPCGEYWIPRKYGHLAWLELSLMTAGRVCLLLHPFSRWTHTLRANLAAFSEAKSFGAYVTVLGDTKTQLAVLAWTAHCFKVNSHSAFHREESRRGATPGCVRRAATSDQPRGGPGRQHANVAICALAAALGH